MKKRYVLRWMFAVLILLAVLGLFCIGISRLQFSTDLLATLPQNDPVLVDARHVLMHNPAMEKVIIDISSSARDAQDLTDCSAFVEDQLRSSGLFRQVGFEHMTSLMPGFFHYAVEALPFLFNDKELAETVAPMLTRDSVHKTLSANLAGLSSMESIGQAGLMQGDPLNLRNLVLSRMAGLIPGKNVRFVNGQIISGDGRHLLVIAEPVGKGSDTSFARKLDALIQKILIDVAGRYDADNGVTLTPVGTYRAALDNEENAKRTVQRATFFSTVAIILLLLGAFPRPLIGLLALVPAFAGTMVAVFVYSLFNTTISLLSVGFGGAIVSFTVDYGIAYLLFLDRQQETKGIDASREVWSLGLVAMLTTAFSFAALGLSGFPALVEIGMFSALGVVFTYIFVHAIFPLVFSRIPAAKRKPFVPLQAIVDKLASSRQNWKLFAAIIFFISMLFFAQPDFHIDLAAFNNVTPQTLEAENLVKQVWGNAYGGVQLMLEANSKDQLAQSGDRVTKLLGTEITHGAVQPLLLPSSLHPGPEVRQENFAAWKRFWTIERIAALDATVREVSLDLGFAPEAFASFFSMLSSPAMPAVSISDELCSLLGIVRDKNDGIWRQVLTFAPNAHYDSAAFHRAIKAETTAKLFDPVYFTERLGAVLLSGFFKMILIVGLVTILISFLYFLDWQLALLGIAPTVFALICTLGTLKLMGQSLGIPTLMVAVVVIGMGTDYALYLIRAYQRYCDDDNVLLGLIRMSTFLSFATTLLGFGVLAVCDNPMLQSAGLGLSLGIGYSFIGAVTIVPPVMKRLLTPAVFSKQVLQPGSREHFKRFFNYYRHMDQYPRYFARFKALSDPMFPRLADFLHEPLTVIDIGTGYGVPAVWLLGLFPNLKVFGIEPDERRVRIAGQVIGERGMVQLGRAPEIPEVPGPADAALLLDMLHYIPDDDVRLTLSRLREKLRPGARLIVRVTIPLYDRAPLLRFVENTQLKLRGIASFFRTAQQVHDLIESAGFAITCQEPTAPGSEVIWFIAEK